MSQKEDENLPRLAQTRISMEIWAKLKPLVRDMRKEPTAAEELLWQKLRGKQLGGYKFRRQHPIGYFIADFYCADARLVIEVDGSVHEQQQEYDELRQAYIESLGLRVLRFENAHVTQTMQGVLERIAEALETPFMSFKPETSTSPASQTAEIPSPLPNPLPASQTAEIPSPLPNPLPASQTAEIPSPLPNPLPASQGEGEHRSLDWNTFHGGIFAPPDSQEE